MKTILLFLSILFCSISYGQNRLIINNDAFVVMENGAKVVIENPASTALQTTGGGNIITATEDDAVIWNIDATTGVYTIPWTTASLVKMPLEINITTAGTGAGVFTFTTYGTPVNNTPFPTGVTNLWSGPSITDNSLKVIDRFWGIDARNYTTKPNVTLSFSYDPAEIASTNTITEANLQAQRWSTTNTSWEDLLFGAQSASLVSNVVVSPTDFFKNWTLTDNAFPLPVELVNFNAVKNTNNEVEISWTTVTEINNNYFEIQKSNDGVNFHSLVQVDGAGNSQNEINYAELDRNPFNGVSYYRLKQVDFDGQFSYSEIRAVEINSNSEVVLFPNPTQNILNISTDYNQETIVQYTIVDITGVVLISDILTIHSGKQLQTINVNHLKSGVYFIQLTSENNINQSIQFIKK